MKHEYWHNKWQSNQIAFHNDSVHPLLAEHWPRFNVKSNARIFVPLCGKTRDIAWLLNAGHHVVGAELSELAIKQLFDELSLDPEVIQLDNLIHYKADNIDIYVGDIFNVTASHTGTIDVIYDRAALVALPADMRKRYTSHLMDIADAAVHCLICFEYDQSKLEGPPFSIPKDELLAHYATHYQLEALTRVDVEGGLKGQCPALEVVWYLAPHST